MNIKELKDLISDLPDDMEILNRRCSDWAVISKEEWDITYGVPEKDSCWVMRSHPTMSDERKMNEKKYLALDGN